MAASAADEFPSSDLYNHNSTLTHLKQLCRMYELRVSGTKAELISRLDEEFSRKLNQEQGLPIQEQSNSSDHKSLDHKSSDHKSHKALYAVNPERLEARIDRALSQRLYLIDRREDKFRILGSTGNVYSVILSNYPTCDCPDYSPVCKHIIFVLCRVLRVPRDSPLIGKTFIESSKLFIESSKLLTLLQQQPSNSVGDDTIHANKKVFDVLDSSAVAIVSNRKPVNSNDECPICFEALEEETLVWCLSTCGNNIHKDCMDQWISCASGPAKCPLCRAVWVVATTKPGNANPYINVSHLTGQSKVRNYGK